MAESRQKVARTESELSPNSMVEDSDSGFLSPPEAEVEPAPGLHGVPVRCKFRFLKATHFNAEKM